MKIIGEKFDAGFLDSAKNKVPIVEIPLNKNCRLFIKREDLIHPQISGNKFWKLHFNVKNYLETKPNFPKIITFGGAFSNHIFAVSALGKGLNIETLGIIRGDELEKTWQENPTLKRANLNGMNFRFVTRQDYRDKQKLAENLQTEFSEALIIPEGGTNELAVEGVKFMLNAETQQFNYLCCAVGTGGTVAGISKFAEPHQKVLGFKAVKDNSLEQKIFELSGQKNFELIDASEKGYGKISDENVKFINEFYAKFNIPLEPIYTSKMFRKIFELIESNYFSENSKILAFHTGGLQGIAAANDKLKRQRKKSIEFQLKNMAEKHYRNCNLCEAICGIEITHENGKILKIEGDKADPFSRGHICPKAVALQDIYEDRNRLVEPVRKTANGWQEISWEEAFDEIASKIGEIQTRFGRDSVAVYQGNPSVHNLGTMLNSRELLKSLRTKNNFSATSVDQLPHHFASQLMLGHPFLIPIPDIDHTDFFLILGGNPLASNGSLMTSPDVKNRLEAIEKRGKVVVIDPRKTETAAFASEHFFIKPATDAYFLLAIINTLFAENLVNLGRLAEFTDSVKILREVSNEFTPEKAENLTGISADEIKRITREFAKSETAICYGR
ncbi:MAG: pyridoxal-phosphate dependent enzyme, partial [Blastocatellia bacterium]|nr:pyridoxal-phosphate dependent enzyme [Blastocatellia bacterium]